MNEIHIGEIIRQRRLELDLTQEQLCQGICEPSTISRLENGSCTPTRSKLEALMQRLGLPGKKYYALMSKHELEIENLKPQITASNIRQEHEQTSVLVEKMESLLDVDDQVNRQFLTRIRVSCGRKVDGKLVPYTLEEQLDLLLDTIRIMVPTFDIDEINHHLYTFDELKIINHIALTLSKLGRVDEALDVYYQLMKYIKKKGRAIRESLVISPLITYNYSRLLCQEERYKEAVKIAQIGIDDCIFYGRIERFPGLLYFQAKSYQELGEIELAEEKFKEAYYLYRATNDMENAKIVQEYLENTMGVII